MVSSRFPGKPMAKIRGILMVRYCLFTIKNKSDTKWFICCYCPNKKPCFFDKNFKSNFYKYKYVANQSYKNGCFLFWLK